MKLIQKWCTTTLYNSGVAPIELFSGDTKADSTCAHHAAFARLQAIVVRVDVAQRMSGAQTLATAGHRRRHRTSSNFHPSVPAASHPNRSSFQSLVFLTSYLATNGFSSWSTPCTPQLSPQMPRMPRGGVHSSMYARPMTTLLSFTFCQEHVQPAANRHEKRASQPCSGSSSTFDMMIVARG